MKRTNTVCFVAGKSAGHILPALTLANKIKENNLNTKIIFFSNHTKLDKNILKDKKFVDLHYALQLIQIPYKKILKIPAFSWQLINSFWQSYKILKKETPKEIISTGGLISIPICLSAKLLKIPITVYELNVQPGKAVKVISKIADKVKICFKKTKQFLPSQKCVITSYPTRFTESDYNLSKKNAIKFIQLDNSQFNKNNKTILVLGGSQGSLFINNLIHKFANQYNDKNLQIIHQVGQNDNFDWHAFYSNQNIPAIVFSYQSDLMPYYIAADLIICRAGAGTLAEVIPLGTPCITIPLQTSYTSHQLDNAIEVANENLQIHVLKQESAQNNFLRFYNQVCELLN